ncbi:c-type cytochrome [Algoriphagus machipongonensis]|uniref:Cytochrome c-related protein n=1 Tax=Algoriphagus machipongonensis TaxID=388413 RepID=A3HZ28_9BACT|nr:cytochrome c [Algoriphagus machipongonensis]EAZ80514.1 cytochrome c-related protein [Algoriphagus machipongonensis]
MKKFVKIFVGLIGFIALIILCFVAFVFLKWDKKYDAPYPELAATQDSTLIARGKYLVYGPAHCAGCHNTTERMLRVDQGEDLTLIGGAEFVFEPGVIRSRNLTPDMETGIGKLTDGEVARVMRNSIGADGRPIFPLMPFQNMSDEDVVAILSYLRSQEPVNHFVKPTEYSFMGKAVLALGLIKPEGPAGTPPKSIKIEPSEVYGKYLANSVANCVGCHSPRDLMSGEFIGPKFSGGLEFEEVPGALFVTPNLTPDPETGIIANWSEEAFVERFKAGRVYEHSPMPWGSFARMSEVDLRAIFRYLKALEPVSNKVEKTQYMLEVGGSN